MNAPVTIPMPLALFAGSAVFRTWHLPTGLRGVQPGVRARVDFLATPSRRVYRLDSSSVQPVDI